MTTQRCGAPTNRGRPCEQVVDVFPCRWHHRAEFEAVLTSVADAIRAAGGWSAFMAEHRPALRVVGE
jgi:hypothetical protein